VVPGGAGTARAAAEPVADRPVYVLCNSGNRSRKAAEILAIQRLAWEPEARLYQDWTIPPLTQSLEELRADIVEMTFIMA
jgi:hypothetical protein